MDEIKNTPEHQTTETTKTATPKTYWLIGAGVAVVILTAGYFVGVPMMHIGQQKTVDAQHKQVNDKLSVVYDSFKRDVFTKADTTVGSGKADVKVGLDAVKEARNALEANSDEMTKFEAWPLLSWNQGYRTATDLDAREERYVKNTKAFLDQYNELLTYVDKDLDLQAEGEKSIKALETISENDTPEKIAAKIDTSAAALQTLITQSKASAVPAFLKEEHTKGIALVEKMVTELKNMSAATRILDIEKLSTSEAEITRLGEEADTLSQSLITKLQRNSPIQKGIDDLRDLNNQIGRLHAKL